MYYLLGIDDTDSPNNEDASLNTATLAITLGQKLESLSLARLLNISCHQLFQHPAIPYSSGNIACCLLLDSEPQKIREIDMITRLALRGESSAKANPGYALAAWNQFDPEIIAWGKNCQSRFSAAHGCHQSGQTLRNFNCGNYWQRCGCHWSIGCNWVTL